MSKVYENDNYTVEIVEANLTEPEGVQVYGLINNETQVREGEFPYLPQALQYADQLNEALLARDAEDEAAPEEATAEATEDKVVYSH